MLFSHPFSNMICLIHGDLVDSKVELSLISQPMRGFRSSDHGPWSLHCLYYTMWHTCSVTHPLMQYSLGGCTVLNMYEYT